MIRNPAGQILCPRRTERPKDRQSGDQESPAYDSGKVRYRSAEAKSNADVVCRWQSPVCRFLLVLTLLVLTAETVLAQTPGPVTPESTQETVSEETLNEARKAIASDQTLDPDARKQASEQLDAAAELLKAEVRHQQTLKTLKNDAEIAVEEQQRIERILAESLPEFSTDVAADATREQLQADVTRAEAEVAEATQQRTLLEAEVARRTTRRAALADLTTRARQALADVNQQLSAKPPEGEAATVTKARRLAQLARRQALIAEVALLEQEGPLYEATARLLTARRDNAAREEVVAGRRADAARKRLAAALRREAEEQAKTARQAVLNAHPDLKEIADRNSELTDLNRQTVAQLEQASNDREKTQTQISSLVTDFETLKQRAEAAQFTHAVGVLLRRHRATLPVTGGVHDQLAERQPVVTELNLQLIDLEHERRALVDLDGAIAAATRRLDSAQAGDEQVQEEVRSLLTAKREVLGSLTQNMTNLLSTLVALDSAERELIDEVDRQSDYIAEHVLWVRSTTAISPTDVSTAASALILLSETYSLTALGGTLIADMAQHPALWTVCIAIVLTLVLPRSRIRHRLREIGRSSVKSNATEFRPTVNALLMTTALATPVPAMIWLVGWRIGAEPGTDIAIRAAGAALQSVAAAYWLVEVFRMVFRPDGLAIAHFGWNKPAVESVRRRLRTVLVMSLPLLAIVEFSRMVRDLQLHATLGRAAFSIMAFAIAGMLFGLLKPKSPLMVTLRSGKRDTLADRFLTLAGLAAIAAPALLGAAALSGYYYTALEFASRIASTGLVVLGLVVVRALIFRWLLVSYRALAIRRNRERREAIQREQGDHEPSDIASVETVPEIELADLNVQTGRMIRLVSQLALLAGIWFIWVDVLPALNFLKRVSWEVTAPGVGVTGVVTLADLVLSIIAFVVTLVAARNLPGLVEIAVLQRLPLDAGARYAASTIVRYLILMIGFVAAFGLVGIGWSSVQWLVAAMSVGLGFGLQEIFANFVSGIILLFERPIRVGDTVTINDVTGTVTRIRTRATTILDWNNKELIVPNRDFVTGNLINWTLSNSNLRVIIPVGIAYGSDTELATRLLYEVAAGNPNVLNDPPPVVVFTLFGESSLDFELRGFVTTPQHYRTIAHSLNMEIDRLFRAHNIEIAFPQRDLHLRSVEHGLLAAATGRAASDSGDSPTQNGAAT